MEKIVMVTWKDAYGDLDDYHEGMPPYVLFHTVGFLVRKDKESVAVAQDHGDGSFRTVTVIPRGMVVSIRRLR
jgi:hypothetical protein